MVCRVRRHHRAADADLRVLLVCAIEALAPRERLVMDLQRRERLTRREIGESLGVTERAV